MMLTLLATACMPRDGKGQGAELCMLVGTYTGESSHGIYTFRFNQETGQAVVLDSFAMSNPSYLTPSADGQRVYAVSEMDDASAAVVALELDKITGKLTQFGVQPTLGGAPCYVATNGRSVLTANYSGGTMSVFPLRDDGRLEPVDSLFQGSATGPDMNRQQEPHVHCACFSPDGNYIFATDFSADRIQRFLVHPDEASPQALAETVDLAPGSGPRHLTFSPNGRQAYLINELSGKVVVFDYLNGELHQKQVIAADTLGARGSADIHLSPDGRYLYASNRLKGDGLAIFSVNPTDGTLAKVGYQLTGLHPRNFSITPNGRYLLVACRDSDVIQVFLRNEETGALTPTQQDIHLSQPVCIQFVR